MRNLIIFFYFPYKLFRTILKLFTKDSPRVRVLLFHDIPRDQHEEFRRKLEFISKSWNFINPKEFEDYLNNKLVLKGDNLLLSFDDGFYSNRVVAETVLDPLGIKALFFVVSDFVKLTNQKEEIEFIKNNLYPDWRNHSYPDCLDEIRSLSYHDLKFLEDSGHSIGCHTASHPDLSKIVNNEALEKEIIDSANELEINAGIKIKHFSYGFGHSSFFSKDALMIAKKRFPFVYTAMRGDNEVNKLPWAIRRDTIALDDKLYLMKSFLEGVADFRYKKYFSIYESWNEEIS